MSFVLDSLYLSPGKNIPKGKPQSVLNVVCNIQGHIWTDLLLCVVVCSHIRDVKKYVSLFKNNVEYQY